jgi:hypothetical protein
MDSKPNHSKVPLIKNDGVELVQAQLQGLHAELLLGHWLHLLCTFGAFFRRKK